MSHMHRAISSGVFRIWQGGHGERAEREPIIRVWRRSPQRGPGQSPWSRSQRGKAPWSWNAFCFLNVQWKPQIRPFFWSLETQKIT